jgi:hypothetical protein
LRPDRNPSFATALLLGVLLLAGCPGPTRDDSSRSASRQSNSAVAAAEVSTQELTVVLASGQFEQTIKVMNRIKRMQHQGHLLPILVDVWDAKFEKYPQASREFASNARIRIEVADVLIQAYRNGALDGRGRERYRHIRSKAVYISRSRCCASGDSRVGSSQRPRRCCFSYESCPGRGRWHVWRRNSFLE